MIDHERRWSVPPKWRTRISPARRAKDSSPVRQHWGNDGPALAPARGGRGHAAVLLTPRSGAGKRGRLLPTAGAVGYFLAPFGLCAPHLSSVLSRQCPERFHQVVVSVGQG